MAQVLLAGVMAALFARAGLGGNAWPAAALGGDVWGSENAMSEVVVQISAEESRDSSLLSNAIDAFAKWAVESGLTADTGDAPDIMMMTEFSGGEMRRKLVFQDRDHAARFLVFWRVERQLGRGFEGAALSA
jgi:hypothetical protein